MPRFNITIATPLCSLLLATGLVFLSVPEAQAQSRRGQQAPAQRQAAPGQSRAPAGSQGPSATRPSNSPSSLGQSPGRVGSPRGQAQTNNNPGTPEDPNQVPLGGAEWLAAAGAAYALNRLRKEEGDSDGDSTDADGDDMP